MNPDDALTCSVCIHKLGEPKTASGESFRRKVEFYGRSESMIPKTKTMAPVGAGSILIINALLSMGGLWMTNIYVSEFLPEVSDAMTMPNLMFGGLAVFVLCGGILAMLRRKWGLTLIACMASFPLVIVFGLFCAVLELMLSVAALVILAQSRDEFISKSRR